MQCGDAELRVDVCGDGPANDPTRIQIQNRRQINEAGSNPDVSDIGDPDLVDSAHLFMANS